MNINPNFLLLFIFTSHKEPSLQIYDNKLPQLYRGIKLSTLLFTSDLTYFHLRWKEITFHLSFFSFTGPLGILLRTLESNLLNIFLTCRINFPAYISTSSSNLLWRNGRVCKQTKPWHTRNQSVSPRSSISYAWMGHVYV